MAEFIAIKLTRTEDAIKEGQNEMKFYIQRQITESVESFTQKFIPLERRMTQAERDIDLLRKRKEQDGGI